MKKLKVDCVQQTWGTVIVEVPNHYEVYEQELEEALNEIGNDVMDDGMFEIDTEELSEKEQQETPAHYRFDGDELTAI